MSLMILEAQTGRANDLLPRSPNGAAPGPFLKWVGGKTQLLPQLDRFLPESIPHYTEPFLGGGAVFFHLWSTGRLTGKVTLADRNEELVNAYRIVRDQVDDLIAALTAHKRAHSPEHYYEVRKQEYSPGLAGAARMVYLNKTCYNGLYRVNSRGQFNVPLGRYANPGIVDEATLRRASSALRAADIVCQDFRETIDQAQEGLIYADPPYVPLSVTASFTGYAPGGFGSAEQEALAACLHQSHVRGVRFVLSNSYTPTVLDLYRGFRIERVPAKRAINSNAARRGPVDEAVVLNFEPSTGVVQEREEA